MSEDMWEKVRSELLKVLPTSWTWEFEPYMVDVIVNAIRPIVESENRRYREALEAIRDELVPSYTAPPVSDDGMDLIHWIDLTKEVARQALNPSD